MENSQSELSPTYLPRHVDSSEHDSEAEESAMSVQDNNNDEDDEEYEYIMMPQMIKSSVTPEIVEAFLKDSNVFDDTTDTEGVDFSNKGEDYMSPLILVSGPPRMMVCSC